MREGRRRRLVLRTVRHSYSSSDTVASVATRAPHPSGIVEALLSSLVCAVRWLSALPGVSAVRWLSVCWLKVTQKSLHKYTLGLRHRFRSCRRLLKHVFKREHSLAFVHWFQRNNPTWMMLMKLIGMSSTSLVKLWPLTKTTKATIVRQWKWAQLRPFAGSIHVRFGCTQSDPTYMHQAVAGTTSCNTLIHTSVQSSAARRWMATVSGAKKVGCCRAFTVVALSCVWKVGPSSRPQTSIMSSAHNG